MLSNVHKMKIRNSTEMILRVPGNYRGGVLEMTIVFDYNLSREKLVKVTGELVGTLKSQSEVFRNVRVHTYKWKNNQTIEKEITPLPILQMGRFFDEYEQNPQVKSLDELTRQLKLFGARSKLVILITDGSNRIIDETEISKNLQPFLLKKMMIIQCKDDTIEISRNL